MPISPLFLALSSLFLSRWCLCLRLSAVEGHGGTDKVFERRLVEAVVLVEINRSACLRFKTGVEETIRVLQRRVLGESNLQNVT